MFVGVGGGSGPDRPRQEQLDQHQKQLQEIEARIDKDRQYHQQVPVWGSGVHAVQGSNSVHRVAGSARGA